MAITNGYCTLPEIKAADALDLADASWDAALERVIEAASRAVDAHCMRRFYVNTDDETRYYCSEDGRLCYTDDLVSITTLATDDQDDRTYSTVWAATDYDMEPYNAAVQGWPYMYLSVAPSGNYNFPIIRRGVKIVGKFGFPAVPVKVRQATLQQAMRFWMREKTVLGSSAMGALGEMRVNMPGLDPDIQQMLIEYRRLYL